MWVSVNSEIVFEVSLNNSETGPKVPLARWRLLVTEAMSNFGTQVTWVALKIDIADVRQMNMTPGEFARSAGDLVFKTEQATRYTVLC